MKEKNLTNGFSIPEIGIGTWPMGGYRVPNPSNDDQKDIDALQHAINQGITHLDTAEMYASGHAEEILGQAIKGFDRTELFIASKASRENLGPSGDIVGACKRSLERVGVEYFDLYYIHWRNPQTELREQMKAMEQLYDEGLIKNIAVSNFNTESLKEAQNNCKYPIVANQVHYNLLYRGPEKDGLVEYCKDNDVMLVAWRPVELGKLANTGNPTMLDMAEKYEKTHAQVAINWLVSQKNVVTLFGGSEKEHIDENLGGIGWRMSDDDIEVMREDYNGQIFESDAVPLG